ncbi:MAG: hypothetical protein M0Z41_13765 [Peptococcaceae bacterium]|jgi:MinD-like ATPase involved in chromosome partitioning or flagellar assembly|nr:hypothetical protein [Peptococcaceae bacterium]
MVIGLVLPAEHPWRGEAAAIGNVSFDGAVEDLTQGTRDRMDVLLLSAALLDEAPDGVEDLRRYRILRPDVRVVMIHSEDTRPGDPLLAACVSMGIYDLAVEGAPLAATLDRTATYADAARWHVSTVASSAAAGKAAKRGPTVVSADGGSATGVSVEVPKVVDPQFHVIWGPKSAGRSVVAAGIASLVARRVQLSYQQDTARPRVALVDMDVEGGDVGTFLGLPPEAEGLEPLSRVGLIDGATVRRNVSNVLGVDVLPAGPYPSQVILAERYGGLPEEAEAFAARLLATMQTEYPFVLVDVPAPLAHPFTFTALANAKEVLFVVRPARAGLRRAISVLEAAWQCGLSRDKFRLVVNGTSQGGIEAGEISAALGLKVTATLPADVPGFLAAETHGRPYALGNAREDWRRLADMVFPVRAVSTDRGPGFLSSLLKGVTSRVAAHRRSS